MQGAGLVGQSYGSEVGPVRLQAHIHPSTPAHSQHSFHSKIKFVGLPVWLLVGVWQLASH